jgi:hypothetical protein
MPQYAVPISTITSAWLTSPNVGPNEHLNIDEGIISGAPDEDSTYIYHTAATKIWQGLATSVTDPQTNGGHILRCRMRWTNPSAFPAPLVTMQMGTALDGIIVNRQISGAAGTRYRTNTYVLSDGEASAISTYSLLALGFTWQAGTADVIACTAIELEVPDPPATSGQRGWYFPQWRYGRT